MTDGQISLISLGAFGSIHLHAQLFKQNAEAVYQHFGPGQRTQFQLFPVPLVDGVVQRKDILGGFYTKIPDGFGDGDPLSLVKIQDGIV